MAAFLLPMRGMFAGVLLVQGSYYLLAGIWPILSIDTFQTVTGPKTDLWLVKTVGALIAVIAVVLLSASWRRQESMEILMLAVGSALVLTAIDVFYVWWHVIPPIYLADAVLELLLLAWWSVIVVRMRDAASGPPA